jgi:hypothetical protein
MRTGPHRPAEAQADPSAGDGMDAQLRGARVRRAAPRPRAHTQHAGHSYQHPSHHPLKHHRPAVRRTPDSKLWTSTCQAATWVLDNTDESEASARSSRLT